MGNAVAADAEVDAGVKAGFGSDADADAVGD